MFTAVNSETGNYKDVNQDSVVLKTAVFDGSSIAFLVVCDGMGGLKNGEFASKCAATHFDRWFEKILPYIITSSESFYEKFRETLDNVIYKANKEIKTESAKNDIQSGTTACAVLIYNDMFYTLNVGDSRAYKVTNTCCTQLTKDQSYEQLLIDEGRLSKEEIAVHPRRNALLQCIGTGTEPDPIYTTGKTRKGDVFFVCSDGFRHKVSPHELFQHFNPNYITSDFILLESIKKLTDIDLDRGERDNISAVAVKI